MIITQDGIPILQKQNQPLFYDNIQYNKIYKQSNKKETRLFIKPITNFNYENMLPSLYQNRNVIPLISILIDPLGISPYLTFNFKEQYAIYPYNENIEIVKIQYPISISINEINPSNNLYLDQDDNPLINLTVFDHKLNVYKIDTQFFFLNLNDLSLVYSKDIRKSSNLDLTINLTKDQ